MTFPLTHDAPVPVEKAEAAPASRETTFGYWERKNDEVALLRDHLKLDGRSAIVTVPDLVREKLQLRAQMIARFIAEHPSLTESNLGVDYEVEIDGTFAGYSYQRYDMHLRRKPFAPWIHPTLASRRLCSLGFLTASGMSSITAVLTALDLFHGAARPLYMAHDTYFETRQFVANYLYQLKPVVELPDALLHCGVLLLDSISEEDPLAWLGARKLGGLCAVILDTTCYDVSAPEIERVVERCRGEGVPCILVRSHLKIDSLGLEYGRLGSIAIVLPRPCDRSRARFAQYLRRRIRDFLIKMGAGFSIPSYFPLSSDPTFRRLNRRRNALMRENNLRCAAALSEIVHPRSEARVVGNHLGRFFFLQPAAADPSGGHARALARALLEAGICARPAPSFGYDFAAITRMIDPARRSGEALRVSLPDCSADELELCIETIARFAIDTSPIS